MREICNIKRKNNIDTQSKEFHQPVIEQIIAIIVADLVWRNWLVAYTDKIRYTNCSQSQTIVWQVK